MFTYFHKVQFYETDQMQIVHHSNYVRFCEEARVAWAMHFGVINYQDKDSASQLAVIAADVRYLKPSYFGDELKIEVQATLSGPRIIFEYKIFCHRRGLLELKQLIAEARTQHVAVNKEMLPLKPSSQLKGILNAKKEESVGLQWIETWLLNL